MLLSDEAVNEIDEFLDRKEYYLNDKGGLHFSSSTDVLDAVLKTLS